jgi:hypothetical protein
MSKSVNIIEYICSFQAPEFSPIHENASEPDGLVGVVRMFCERVNLQRTYVKYCGFDSTCFAFRMMNYA